MFAKVIDAAHPLSGHVCEIGFSDDKGLYPLIPVRERFHGGHATRDQLHFIAVQYLGAGLLSWPTYERISGRYGVIALFGKGETGLQPTPWNVDVSILIGKHGTLIAVLDYQQYELGAGTFFTEQDFGATYVGLKPGEKREEDWLDTDMLRKVDGMLIRKPIELYFFND